MAGEAKLTVYSGLKGWYRADTYKGIVSSGSAIPSAQFWKPTSGYGTALGVYGQPTYYPPMVTIYPSGYFMNTASPATGLPTTSTELSIFAYFGVSSATGSILLLGNASAPGSNCSGGGVDFLRFAASGSTFLADACFNGLPQSPPVIVSGTNNTGEHIHQIRWSGTGQLEYRVENVGTTSQTSYGTQLQVSALLAVGDNIASANAYVGEFLIYDRRVTDSEAESIRSYLANRFYRK